jgi:hypothetical protein
MDRSIIVVCNGKYRPDDSGVVPASPVGYYYRGVDRNYSNPHHTFAETDSAVTPPILSTEQLQELVDWAKTKGVSMRSI